jgi:hypothetical protein
MFAYDHHRISDRIGKKLPPGVSVSKLTTKNKKKEYAVTLSRRVEIRYLSRANVRKQNPMFMRVLAPWYYVCPVKTDLTI